MTEQELIAENERLRILVLKLESDRATLLSNLRFIQRSISSADCQVMALINFLLGTNR